MGCAWKAYMRLLPPWMREQVDMRGREELLELRLRLGLPPEMVLRDGSFWLNRIVTQDDLNFCVNGASQYSPWASETAAIGYLTAAGGHRLGLCGLASAAGQAHTGLRCVSSVCLRVARDLPGISGALGGQWESVLIIGRPGSGKTTLLRDLLRYRSNTLTGCVAVVDEKGEIFPRNDDVFCFPVGRRTDVLTGYKKTVGIDMMLRNMSPGTIAMDEITAIEDCQALLQAGWCGVKLIATAHADSKEDLFTRPIYKPLVDSKLFDVLVILQEDKSWRLERMNR